MNAPPVEVRRAVEGDYADIAALLSTFVYDALAPDERRRGFLQGEFTTDGIRWFDRSAGVFVARDEGRVVGALCACALNERALPPQVEALRTHVADWRLDGQEMPLGRTLCYGPVCIDQRHRGQGLLRRLFSALVDDLAPGFDHGVAFVAAENPRSLAAHCEGLGMRRLGVFDDGARIALGFRLERAPG